MHEDIGRQDYYSEPARTEMVSKYGFQRQYRRWQLESLFQTEEPKKKPLILEKKFVEEKPKVRFQEKQNHNNEL